MDWSNDYPSEPLSSALIRSAVERRLAPYLAPQDVRDVVLATAEAVANAIRHGAGPVSVSIQVSPSAVRVCVRDSGGGFDPCKLAQAGEPPAGSAESGRGLFLMRHAAGRVEASFDHGTSIEIVHDRRPQRPAAGAAG